MFRNTSAGSPKFFFSAFSLLILVCFEDAFSFNVDSTLISGSPLLSNGQLKLGSRTTLFSSTLRDGIKPNTGTSGKKKVILHNSIEDSLPFVIESVSPKSKVNVFEEITRLCIDVFFNEEAEKKIEERNKGNNSPWKEFLLAYLRNLQTGDFRTRTFEFNRGVRNEMFVARKVIPLPETSNFEDTNPIKSSDIINIKSLKGASKFRRGEIIGFVDITEKIIGIAEPVENELGDGVEETFDSQRRMRPVLTNLAVMKEARKSGVGSRLVETCENAVLSWGPPMASREHSEIILQVEESNSNAQIFYEKRGYKVLFKDPSCRRLDSSGLLLKKVPTTKICYRKTLNSRSAPGEKIFSTTSLDKLIAFFAK